MTSGTARTGDIEIMYELPGELVDEAVELVVSTFDSKLAGILDRDRCLELFKRNVVLDRCVCAVRDGSLLGVLSIRSHEGGLFDARVRDVFTVCGPLRGIWVTMGLMLFDHPSAADEYHIDCLAVAEDARGRGVGSGLISALQDKAARDGIDRLTLMVIDENPRARSLYERSGFVDMKEEDAWPFNRIFHLPFRRATLMEKRVPARGA